MMPIAAVQATTPDLPDPASASSANGSAANAFLALFAQAMSGNKAKTDPATALLAEAAPDAPSTDNIPNTTPEGTDPTGQALMQSLALPALATNLDPATVTEETADTGNDTATPLPANMESGQKLPSRLATLAEQLVSGKTDEQAKTDPKGMAYGQTAKDAGINFGSLVSAMVSKADTTPSPTIQHTTSDGQSGQTTLTQLSPTAHALTTPQTTVPVDKPVMTMQAAGFGSPAWQQELSDKVTWMASNQGGHVSNLVLNPPSLGTVEIRLHVQGAEAGAQFYAANADVRNALEQSMPRLREMMANAGIVLGDAMVSNQSFSQRESAQSQDQYSGTQSGSQLDVNGVTGGTQALADTGSGRLARGNSLLDYYA